ncbi:MAG: radical SAM protein [Rudaea sp.]
MTSGIVFDIREFAVHDGPGIRTTVFLKGCPLRCSWCHNPEGMSAEPQRVSSASGERIAGKVYSAQELADLLNRQGPILRANEGGVTFSGGEPLMQSSFVADVIDRLRGVHVLLDTSGYSGEAELRRLASRSQLVFFDLKLLDPQAHLRYTGRDNAPILKNLRILSGMGIPFVIRVPLVPGVTDTDENLGAIVQTLRGLPGLQHVDLLPYNRAAGSKYKSIGLEFNPGYDETRPVNVNTGIFRRAGLEVRVA